MSAYNLGDLAQIWANEEITKEQMIGQLLVIAIAQEERLETLEKKLSEVALAQIPT